MTVYYIIQIFRNIRRRLVGRGIAERLTLITPLISKRGDREILVGIPSATMIRRWATPTHARHLPSVEQVRKGIPPRKIENLP
jgi:hypothetical protein